MLRYKYFMIIVPIILLIVRQNTYGQEKLYPYIPEPKELKYNIFYVEALGNGGTFSFNYERQFQPNLSLRFGLGIDAGTSTSNSGEHPVFGLDIIFMLNFLIKIINNNNFILGVGAIPTRLILPTFSIGYQYSPLYGGAFFQITFDNQPNIENKFIPWVGVGIGSRF